MNDSLQEDKMTEAESSFKKQFQEFFWWAAPISLIADIIGIVSALNTKQQYSQLNPSGYVTVEPKVWGVFALSDVVFLTGLLTAFAIASMLYSGYRARLVTENSWAIILAVFASLFLVYLYFRLWLGENWWVFACVIPIAIIIGIIIEVMQGTGKIPTTSPRLPITERFGTQDKPTSGLKQRNILEENNILERDNILKRYNILERENILKRNNLLDRNRPSGKKE